MCAVCIEYAKGTINRKEAFRAIGEVAQIAQKPEDLQHLADLHDKLFKEHREEMDKLRETK